MIHPAVMHPDLGPSASSFGRMDPGEMDLDQPGNFEYFSLHGAWMLMRDLVRQSCMDARAEWGKIKEVLGPYTHKAPHLNAIDAERAASILWLQSENGLDAVRLLLPHADPAVVVKRIYSSPECLDKVIAVLTADFGHTRAASSFDADEAQDNGADVVSAHALALPLVGSLEGGCLPHVKAHAPLIYAAQTLQMELAFNEAVGLTEPLDQDGDMPRGPSIAG